MALTPRGRSLRWLSSHRGLTEDPPSSNSDHRKDGIRAAQIRCADGGSWLIGLAWCGVWQFNALKAGGVKGLGSWMASVSEIEKKARAKQGPFRGWLGPNISRADWEHKLFRADLVVLFGEGVHVAGVREAVFSRSGVFLGVWTDEGNTSSGPGGSQSNGGGSFRRFRTRGEIHGFALVDFPNS